MAECLRGKTRLNLHGCCIGEEGMVLLTAALANNNTITRLCLHDNNMSDEGAKSLATVLHTNSALTMISLGDNRISDEGAKALATVLRMNNTLTILSLGNNIISDEGAKALEGIFEQNDTMLVINMCDNEIAGDIISSINAALAANNFLFPKGLRWAIRMQDADALANLVDTTSVINLYHGNIGDEGMKVLATALRNNITVTEIDLRGNKISNAGANALINMFKSNDTVMKIDLTDNKIDDILLSLIDSALAPTQVLRAAKADPHTISEDHQKNVRVFGALQSDVAKKASTNKEIKGEITSTTESGGRTIVKLLNEVAVKVKHEMSQKGISTDEQIEALEIIQLLKSELKKDLSKKSSVTRTMFKSLNICKNY